MRKFFQYFKVLLNQITSLNRSPKDLAKATALGIFLGFSPYFGIHTYLAIFLSGYFKLPVYPALLGTLINNPITLPLVYGFSLEVGLLILGKDSSYLHINWSDVHIKTLLTTMESLLLPFVIGTHIVGLLVATLFYFISLPIYTHFQNSNKIKK